MKVTTDACLFGAWVASEINNVVDPDPFGKELIINNCLDIGVGTGLLSLMIAQKNQEISIDSIEIDRDAAEQAKENAVSSSWKERINVINADIKKFSFTNKYDLIISNPPFYENELRSENERKNIAHHSDHLGLDELLTIVKENLTITGSFYLLLPYKRNDEIKKIFKDHKLHISKILLVRQSVKHDYFRIMIKGKVNRQENEEIKFDEIFIWDDKQQYTNDFIILLKDYYLYL